MITLQRPSGSATCVLSLTGDIDSVSVPDVREAIESAVSDGCTAVVLDLAEVEYIDSSALGLLVWADHRLQPVNGTLLLAGAGHDVGRILELSGLIGVAPSVFVADSVESALAGLTPAVGQGVPLWTQSFEVSADASLMADARARVASMLAPLGMADSAVFDVKVAAGEALANAVRHGSPNGLHDAIRVDVGAFDDRVEILVSDSGCGFDGVAEASVDVFAPSGRGVLFMKALVDVVEFVAEDGEGTRVRLTKRRIRSAESAP